MKDLLASLRKAILQGLKALSYADNGELLPLSSKIRILHGKEPHAIPQPLGRTSAVAPRKRIVVAFDGQVEHGTLRYAADVALRYDATLDIMTNADTARLGHDTECKLRDNALDWQALPQAGDMLTALIRHTLRHSAVMFVVTSDHDALTGQIVATRQADCKVKTPLLIYCHERLRAA